MIRLDGNSLAAFRGAGVAGTVQSVAGCELFGAARIPSWASPYSAAATAALKAQFPTQWPTIRDYGFAHPEIVGYMNAYAPEDAKIAYSLVEGIGTRYWIQDGTSYVTTDYLATKDSVLKTSIVPKTLTNNVWWAIYGGETAETDLGGFGLCINNGKFRGSIGSGTSHTTTQVSAAVDTKYDIVANHQQLLINNTVALTNSATSTDGTVKIDLFKMHRGSSHVDTSFKGYMEYFEFTNCQDGNHKLVPFIRNNQAEFLDLVTGNLATRVGSFTISESPA